MNFIRNFIVACQGLAVAVKEELNMKIHIAAMLLVMALGFYFEVSQVEWLILLIMIGLVICTELINTAIENLTDLVSPERQSLAGKVKDIAAAAVLFISFISVIVGFIIFAKYFKALFA
ncbi:MAG TPA: diacylglycerol kinase family protein [Cyclobacteriaceae bacterium]